jgi:threonine synthase
MRYLSTRGNAPVLGFDDVLLAGLAVDGGLYVPDEWPTFEITSGDYADIAAAVIRPFVAGSVIEEHLDDFTRSTYARFRHPEVAPLRDLGSGHYLLELFWGPTLSFKDYALQFVGEAFDAVLAERSSTVTVLGATSGDTGSAAIAALADRSCAQVVILYPEGRVSDVQRRQMTTVTATNVMAVAVQGTFDDCQRLVKETFSDPSMRARFNLAAVNSINWGRVMAQAAYYAWVGLQLGGEFDVAVPTGNFGNLFAAEVARRGGVPIKQLIVGTNANHGLIDIIERGKLVTQEVVPTIAPAMDIQVPSNFERYMFELVDRDADAVTEAMALLAGEGSLVLDERTHARLAERLAGYWYGEGEIEEGMERFYAETGHLLDPHSAIGWLAGTAAKGNRPMVSVATAHPAKFADAVQRATGVIPALPDDLADLAERPERTQTVAATPQAVADLLDELPRS